MASDAPEVTALLQRWRAGESEALEQLIPIVYAELHKIADAYLRRERDAGVLQPTALIHEAYLKLVGERVPDWKSRAHFYGVAARRMREILVDHARRAGAAKRGGAWRAVSLDQATLFSDSRPDEFLLFDSLLERLAGFDARKARVLELHFFAGMTVDETAEALEVSPRTVARDLTLAQAWLRSELSERPG